MSLLSTLQALETARTRPGVLEDAVVDFSFVLTGDCLPVDYPVALESAVVGRLPWAGADAFFGIHAIKAPLTDAGYMLSRRARLQIRSFASNAGRIEALSGCVLDIGGYRLAVGACSQRPLTPFATLRAQMVVNTVGDEHAFLDDIGMQLEVLAVKAGVMCGKPASLGKGSRRLEGYAVVLHELSPSHSIRLQTLGLGGGRRLGCGLFVHHKIIESPEVWPE